MSQVLPFRSNADVRPVDVPVLRLPNNQNNYQYWPAKSYEHALRLSGAVPDSGVVTLRSRQPYGFELEHANNELITKGIIKPFERAIGSPLLRCQFETGTKTSFFIPEKLSPDIVNAALRYCISSPYKTSIFPKLENWQAYRMDKVGFEPGELVMNEQSVAPGTYAAVSYGGKDRSILDLSPGESQKRAEHVAMRQHLLASFAKNAIPPGVISITPSSRAASWLLIPDSALGGTSETMLGRKSRLVDLVLDALGLNDG